MFEQCTFRSEGHEPSELDSSDPTPEEIQKRSAEIRTGWSERVSKRRKAHVDISLRLPLGMTIELVRQLNSNRSNRK